jgi:D-arabinose 1-dehydrogenase-like Zn-dependent alcohol dehydrogenase
VLRRLECLDGQIRDHHLNWNQRLGTSQGWDRFPALAPEIGIVTETTRYPLNQANQALADLRAGRFEGAAVLVP